MTLRVMTIGCILLALALTLLTAADYAPPKMEPLPRCLIAIGGGSPTWAIC